MNVQNPGLLTVGALMVGVGSWVLKNACSGGKDRLYVKLERLSGVGPRFGSGLPFGEGLAFVVVGALLLSEALRVCL